MAPAGNKSLRLSRASHVKYKYLPTYLDCIEICSSEQQIPTIVLLFITNCLAQIVNQVHYHTCKILCALYKLSSLALSIAKMYLHVFHTTSKSTGKHFKENEVFIPTPIYCMCIWTIERQYFDNIIERQRMFDIAIVCCLYLS